EIIGLVDLQRQVRLRQEEVERQRSSNGGDRSADASGHDTTEHDKDHEDQCKVRAHEVVAQWYEQCRYPDWNHARERDARTLAQPELVHRMWFYAPPRTESRGLTHP